MNSPKLSVIIPHYNSSNSLEKLLLSLSKYRDTEIIIVDDYSSIDEINTVKKIIKSMNLNIILLENDEKKSAGTCRNIGIKKSTGKFILFADADDYFVDESEIHIDKYLNKKHDIVFFVPTSIYLDNGKISNRHVRNKMLVDSFSEEPSRENELMLRTKFIEPWSKLFRADFIKDNQLKFDDTIISNDVFFSVTSGMTARNIDICSNVIYCVTKNSGSITTIIDKERYIIKFNVFIKQVCYLKECLSNEEFMLLNIDGKSWLLNSIFYKLGLKTTLRVFTTLRSKKIKIINPKNIRVKKLIKYIDFLNIESKYRQ